LFWDTFPVYPGEPLRLIFESAAPDRRRGIFFMINGELECNGVRSRALDIWVDNSPPEVFITCYPIAGPPSLYHILEHAGNRWSQLATKGMLTEDIPRGRRLRCWDGEYSDLNPPFDRLVFTLDRAEPARFKRPRTGSARIVPPSKPHPKPKPTREPVHDAISLGEQNGGTPDRICDIIHDLRILLRTICKGPYSPDVDEFALLFRVDGRLIQWDWNTDGLGRLRRDFNRRFIQIDVGIPLSRTHRVPGAKVRLFLIDSVGQAFQSWVARLQRDRTPIDAVRLFDDFARVRRRYLSHA
jgi:hypothetical protein